MAHTHPLEGDGIQVNLFQYLWKKGQGLEDKKLKFKIPDTIVFYNFPIVWYYWSENSQEIRKKGGKELERQHIKQAFCKNRESSDVCDIVASFLSHRQDEEDKIVFFNEAELSEFLEGKPTQQGLLQKFVVPRGAHNEMVQAIWSPRFCMVNKRINRYKLNDRHCSRTQKAITFEGATHYTEEAMTAPAIRKRVKEVCVSFVEHFKSVEHHYNVSRMVMYFKEDRRSNDKMWLMFSSSFRINEQKFQQKKTPVSLTPHFQGLYNDIELDKARKDQTRPSSAPAKRFRQGYLKNVRVEDMEALAQAALNAGLAAEDDGAELGLKPIATMPLPTSLQHQVITSSMNASTTKGSNSPNSAAAAAGGQQQQGTSKLSANAVSAPNDTIKSEMLLERIYFNKKTKKIKADIKRWEQEANKIVDDLAVIRKHKEAFKLGLVSPEQSRKRIRNLPEIPNVHDRLTPQSRKKKSDETDDLNETRSPDTQSPNSNLNECHTASTTGGGGGTGGGMLDKDRTNSVLSSNDKNNTLTGFAIGDELALGRASASSLTASVSDTSYSKIKKGSPTNKKREHDDRHSINADSDNDSPHHADKEKQKRLQDALSLLTGENKDQRRKQRSKLKSQNSKDHQATVYNSPENVDAVMKYIGPSVNKYFKQVKVSRLEMADTLDDSIYNCYSELALQYKTASYYCFSLSTELADIIETNFRANLEALRIKRYHEFLHNRELEVRRKATDNTKQPSLPHRLAQLRGVKDNVRAMTPSTAAGAPGSVGSGTSLFVDNINSRPTTSQSNGVQINEAQLSLLENFGGVGPKMRPDTSQTTCSVPPVLLGGGMADVADENVVVFAITKQERSTVNEFNRFLGKVRGFMIESADQAEACLAGAMRERLRDMQWVKTLETITAPHPLAEKHMAGCTILQHGDSFMTTSSLSD